MKYFKYVLGTFILLVLGFAFLTDPARDIGCAYSAKMAVHNLRVAMQRGNINNFKKALHKRLAILNYEKSYLDNTKSTKDSSSSKISRARHNATLVYKFIYNSIEKGKVPYYANSKCKIRQKKPFSYGMSLEYSCLAKNGVRIYFYYTAYKRKCGWIVGGLTPGKPYIPKSVVE